MSKKASFKIILRNERGFAKIRYAKSYSIKYGKKVLVKNTKFPPSIRLVKEKEAFLLRVLNKIVGKGKTKRLSFKVTLRNKAGFAQLSKATMYSVSSGKRKIITNKPFPSSIKTVAQKKSFLEKLTKKLEKKREKDLEKRQIKFQLDVNNARYEPPITLKNVSISDVLITPILPETDEYIRELINKTIVLMGHDDIERALAILNFTLKDGHEILVTNDNFFNEIKTVFKKFWIHLKTFWADNKDSSDAYIFRLKFRFEHDNEFYDHGISVANARQEIPSEEILAQIVEDTYYRLVGENYSEVITFSGKRKTRGARDYLRDGAQIVITGFTLESALDESPTT